MLRYFTAFLVVLLGLAFQGPWPAKSSYAAGKIQQKQSVKKSSGTSSENDRVILGIEPQKKPNQLEWKAFQQAAPKSLLRLWQQHMNRGRKLSAWVWEWRMGWVKVCTYIKDPLCDEILFHGLFDQALVVRAESAVAVGRRFQGSENKHIVTVIEKASKNPENLRRGRPLFVQKRFLHALKMIGGDAANAAATRITNKHAELKKYWDQLNLK